jgi:adenylate cyclase
MGVEIERKFLLQSDSWQADADGGEYYHQGYLSTTPERVVRVRQMGEKAVVTIKGKGDGISRPEFEYEIPLGDAQTMLRELCLQPTIEKRRHKLTCGPHTWEIDVFAGENEGLVVAEIELTSEDEAFEKPDWVGAEVSHDTRYLNSNLIAQPFKSW